MTTASASTVPQSGADAPLRLPFSAEEKAARWRAHAWQVQAFIMASYCLDGLWMVLFAINGVLSFQVPLVFLVLFCACGVAFTVALVPGVRKPVSDPFFTIPQMLAASAIQFGFMLWVPQIGLLLLTVLFIIVGFGGLRLRLGQAGFVSLWLAGGICLVIALRGPELSVPLGSTAERLISAVWISSAVARSIMLGQYAAMLRKVLTNRNEALKRSVQIAERLVSRDALTGALNRATILKAIEVERVRMSRTGHPFSLVLLDLDHFKGINDGFGHLVGDQVLIRTVAQISSGLRGTDGLGRYGGEEFLLLLGGPSHAAEALVVVERMLRSVQDHDWSELATGLGVTTSAGVAVARPDETVLQIIDRADTALYRAKNAGRNRLWIG